MRRRDARQLTTDLQLADVDGITATEIVAAATHEPTRHRLRITAEVAAAQAIRIPTGLLSVDDFFRRAWGVGVQQYFATPGPRVIAPAAVRAPRAVSARARRARRS